MDIDVTFLFQLGFFLVILLVLNGVLFKPFLGVLDARHQKLHGIKDAIAKLEKDATFDLELYEQRWKEAKDRASKERESIINAGRDEERRLLADVRAEISKSVNDARKEVAAAEILAKKNLSAETDQLARKLVEKVLGREVARS